MRVSALQPWVFLLIPVYVFYSILVLKKRRNTGDTRSALILRLLIVSCILGAMADITISRNSQQNATVFLIDVSESFQQNRQKAVEMVKESLKERGINDQIGVVAFGGKGAVEQFVTKDPIFNSLQTKLVTTSTNIKSGIEMGLAMFPQDSGKRMVLITDGKENKDTVSEMTAAIRAAQVSFQVIQLDTNPGAEVYISNVEMPEKITAGDNISVQVDVKSTVKTKAQLFLYAGEELRKQETVQVQKGNNSFVFQDRRRKKGFLHYRVEINPEQDSYSQNNSFVTYTEAGETDKILVIEGREGEGKKFANLLHAANVNCDRLVASNAPNTIHGLNQYKTIVLENVFLNDLPEGFLKNIESFTKDYGGGVIAVGGDNSFAIGGYRDTVLEEILPVDMELTGEKEIPKMAMALVIDHSGSMMDGWAETKLSMAKAAANAAVDNLRKTDVVGVLAFDTAFQWVSKMSECSEPEEIQSKIAGIGPAGGTSIYPAVNEAYKALKDTDASLKHIILLTDGQDSNAQYSKLISNICKEKITLSAVAIGSDSDQKLLSKLATEGKGRFYHTEQGTDLPRIFAQEVFLSTDEYLVNHDFVPICQNNHEILHQVANEELPVMHGYVATTAKDRASVILKSDKDDPVLACWQYGLGRTVAFTSDVTNEWTGEYASWEHYESLWRNIVDWTLQEEEGGGIVHVSQDGNDGIVTYETSDDVKGNEVEVLYHDAEEKLQTQKMTQIAPGKFQTAISVTENGVYELSVHRTKGGEIQESKNTVLTVQYSDEYRFLDNQSSLETLVEQSGGRYRTDLEGIFEEPLAAVETGRNITIWLLVAGTILFLYDVICRRLQISLVSICRKKIAGVGKSGKEEGAITASVDRQKEKTWKRTISSAEKISRSKESSSKKSKKNRQGSSSGNQPDSEGHILDTGTLLRRQEERNHHI